MKGIYAPWGCVEEADMKFARWIGWTVVICCLLGTVTDADAGWPWHRGGKKIRGSGDVVTESRDVGDFKRIKIEAAFDLNIKIGEKTSLKLTFDDNLMELIATEVSGKTLRLDTYSGYRSRESCLVEITVPSLERITTDGAADIIIEGFDGGFFEYNLSGAGDLDAEGSLDELEININGAGDVDMENVITKDVDISISGTGNVSVYAAERLRARISGVGNIRYYGDPEDVSKHVSGMGRIKKR
jgi:Putative auto-transporter adhesin, head GIN domain